MLGYCGMGNEMADISLVASSHKMGFLRSLVVEIIYHSQESFLGVLIGDASRGFEFQTILLIHGIDFSWSGLLPCSIPIFFILKDGLLSCIGCFGVILYVPFVSIIVPGFSLFFVSG